VTTEIWSHRGILEGSAEMENTPAAFAAASVIGIEGIELDTWRVSDGGFLVHHDRDVPGVGAVDALVAASDWHGIPRLEEALAACRVRVVNVELKVPREAAGTAARLLGVELAERLAEYACTDNFGLVVSSFSPDALVGFRERSQLPVGLLVEERPRTDELDEIMRCGWQAVHVHWSGWDLELWTECAGRRLGLVVWTVDDDDGLRAALRAPLRAVITERPRQAIELRAEPAVRMPRD
jgi:glycerophosphoryl diester phosphodiesterase